MIVYSMNHTVVKIEFSPSFFISSSERLARRSLSISPWFTHKPAPFCSAQVHDVSVFDERHFDNCRFYQWYTPTALMKEAILNLV